MISIIIAGLIFVVVALFPIMFAAKKLGAEKHGLIDALIALIVASVAVALISPILPAAQTNEVAAFAYALLITGGAYKFLLRANYLIAILIALLAWGIQLGIGLILGAVLS